MMSKRCIVVTYFDERQPGFLDFSYRLHALANAYDLEVVLSLKHCPAELEVEGVHYHHIPMRKGKVGWVRYLIDAARYIKRQNPDVVVLLHSALAPLSLLLRSSPTCLYWNEHPTNLMHLPTSFSPLRWSVTILLQKSFFWGARNANLIMPIGEAHYQDLLDHGVSNNKMALIYMGVSDIFLAKENQVDKQSTYDQVKLIYVGTVSEARGRDVMLEAMAIVAQDTLNVRLTIVGASSEQVGYCQNRISELGIASIVKVIKRIPGAEVPDYIHRSDFGVCLWEVSPWTQFNPPTKLFEYLVAGLPVLASDIKTHTSYISHWKNGLVFEYSAEGLADVIHELVQNKHQIDDLKSRALVSGKHHRWKDIEPIFISAIRQVEFQ